MIYNQTHFYLINLKSILHWFRIDDALILAVGVLKIVSESLTKVILFLLKKSISLEDQPPSGPITFQKIPPFIFTNSCCFLNHWFKSYNVSSLVTEIETLSWLSLLFSHSIISIPVSYTHLTLPTTPYV